MEKIIATIVPQLLSKLSKDKPYYTQSDLSGYGFPHFLIKRITFHLIKELSKEFILPGKEWLDTDSDDLLSEWADLQRIIKREIHLPATLAEGVIEKSVRECVGMTIQPRKVIPDLLFEESDELDSNQLTERSSSITVNRFLVWSMVRYMEKKDRESLTIADAKRIIEVIDDKIVENYHPLNWLSLVKPLYELSGSSVHTDLFRLFFEHKGRNPLAKEFDLINGEIKESKFVEILSSPNSIYVEGYKSDQQTLFKDEATKRGEKQVTNVVKDDEELHKDLAEGQDELIEDSSDQIPIHQAFREEQDDKDFQKESEPWVDQTADAQDTELEQKDIEDESHDELRAPWDEDEDDTATLLDAFKVDDEPITESEKIAEEEQEGILEAESELPKKDQQIPDAALLEIEEEAVQTEEASDSVQKGIESTAKDVNDEDDDVEEESLYSRFESSNDEDLIFEESSDEEEFVATDNKEAAILEVDSETEIYENENEDEEESSLHNRFMFDDSDLEDFSSSDKPETQKKVKTIYDELNLVRTDAEPKTMDLFGSTHSVDSDDVPQKKIDLDEKPTKSESEDSEFIQKFSDIEEPEDEKDSDESDVPMWKSFLERDEEEVKSAFQFDDEIGVVVNDVDDVSDEKLDEDGYIEEPIYDLTKKEPDLKEKIGNLSHWMQDVREKFIDELFGDSEDAYEQALSDIVEFDDWKNASRYIEKEIFTRNRIDVYDEIAVDFTDRLHSYFIENKS